MLLVFSVWSRYIKNRSWPLTPKLRLHPSTPVNHVFQTFQMYLMTPVREEPSEEVSQCCWSQSLPVWLFTLNHISVDLMVYLIIHVHLSFRAFVKCVYQWFKTTAWFKKKGKYGSGTFTLNSRWRSCYSCWFTEELAAEQPRLFWTNFIDNVGDREQKGGNGRQMKFKWKSRVAYQRFTE